MVQFIMGRGLPAQVPEHVKNSLMSLQGEGWKLFESPFVNQWAPPFVLVKKDSGLILIEVSDLKIGDWKLNYLSRLEYPRPLAVEKISPFEKLEVWVDRAMPFFIEGMAQRFLNDFRVKKRIKRLVLFTEMSTDDVNGVFKRSDFKFSHGYTLEGLPDSAFIGNDSLRTEKLQEITRLWEFEKDFGFLDQSFFDQCERSFVSVFHDGAQGRDIKYSKEKLDLIESRPSQQKIRGVIGSGKTWVLARRAVNAWLRTKKPVLILTYNVSLRNYMRNSLKRIKEDFPENAFHVFSYFDFFRISALCHNLPLDSKSEFDVAAFFEKVKDNIEKYDSVFIDEIQDFKEEWLHVIKRYFLSENGEYVVFGDEKQNIFDRKMEDDSRPFTGVPGQYWNVLKQSFRFNDRIAKLAKAFQNEFFAEKYELDEVEVVSQLSLDELFLEGHIEYRYFEKELTAKRTWQWISDHLNENDIQAEETGVLASSTDFLRSLEPYFSLISAYPTKCNGENQTSFFQIIARSYGHEPWMQKGLKFLKGDALALGQALSMYFTFEGFERPLRKILSGKRADKDKFAVFAKEFASRMEEWNSFRKDILKHKHFLTRGRYKTDLELDAYSRNLENHFRVDQSAMVFSPIPNFKGWEADTLFLILNASADPSVSSHELIYTGISRARKNLIVLNEGNEVYHSFFTKYLTEKS